MVLAAMPRPPRPDRLRVHETVNCNFRLPATLHAQIKVLAMDPRTGRVPDYGWSRIVEEALGLWLERRQVKQAILEEP